MTFNLAPMFAVRSRWLANSLLLLLALLVVRSSHSADQDSRVSAADNKVTDKLIDFAFKKTVYTSGLASALAYRDRGYSFESLEEINRYNVAGAHVAEGSAQLIELEHSPLESPYWFTVRSPEAATALLRSLAADFSQELNDSSSISAPTFDTALQKALSQRDLYQIYSLICVASDHTNNQQAKASAVHLERLVATLLRRECQEFCV